MNIISTIFGNDTHKVYADSYILGRYMKYSSYADVYITRYDDEYDKDLLDSGKLPPITHGEKLVSEQRKSISLEDFVNEVKRWLSNGNGCTTYIALGCADLKRSTWRTGAVSKHRYSLWKSERSSHSYKLFNITNMPTTKLDLIISWFNNVNVRPLTEMYKESKKKQYTKKQIIESIAYWEKQLRKMNESIVSFEDVRKDLDKVIDDIHALRSNGDIDEDTAEEAFDRLENLYELFR